jgi:hypothetical protein
MVIESPSASVKTFDKSIFIGADSFGKFIGSIVFLTIGALSLTEPRT